MNAKVAKRFSALDSLRGLAAISVFCLHMLSITYPEELLCKPWFFFAAGNEAVILFFVLSGFVLTMANESNDKSVSYFYYLVRRIFRIYPAYYLSIVATITLFFIIKPDKIPLYTSWFNSQFPSIKFSFATIKDVVLLITTLHSKINGPVWSLAYEVIISVLVLPLFWKYKNNFVPRLILLLVIFFMILVNSIIKYHFHHLVTQFGDTVSLIFGVAFYTLFFIIGAELYYWRNNLQLFAKSRLLPCYIIIYAAAFFAFGDHWSMRFREVLAAIGAVGFISLAIHNAKMKKILEHKIMLFYGRISYSFYLFHIPIMYGMIYTLGKVCPLDFIILLIFIITTLVSYIVHKYVEQPCINISKRLYS